MDKKKVLPVVLAASITVEALLAMPQPDSLAPQPHSEFEIPEQKPVATTETYLAASGRQVAFDNEAFSPALPWARWWRADESRMTAVQGMMQLGV